MSSRKPGYLISLILFGILFSAPPVLFCTAIGVKSYHTNASPLSNIPGLQKSPINVLSPWLYATFWQDRFFLVGSKWGKSGRPEAILTAYDPETGGKQEWLELPTLNGYLGHAFGDRYFLLPNHIPIDNSYEVIDASLKESKLRPPKSVPYSRFLFHGEPAYVDKGGKGFELVTFDGMKWVTESWIDLPNQDQAWSVDGEEIRFSPADATLRCLNQGEQLHVFLSVDNHLFYRDGLNLKSTKDASTENGQEPEAMVSTDARLAGWSLIRKRAVVRPTVNYPMPNLLIDGGMLIEGRPAALIVDENFDGEMVGTVYRYDGTTWTPSETQRFPLASHQFKALPCRDGQASYLLVATPLGLTHFYRVDANGFQFLRSDGSWMPFRQGAFDLSVMAGICLGSGIILGLFVWLLMWLSTKSEYAFGQQTLRLASLGRRGLARLMDLAGILVTLIVIGWVLMHQLEWTSMWDAINLKIDHPSIAIASRAIMIMMFALVSEILGLLYLQGRTGLTPGKWCCGLRTLRSTLRPCGFARSLTRELLMCVDSCNLLCFTPGILSIALTDHRQRLGDLVADTIVVDASTLRR